VKTQSSETDSSCLVGMTSAFYMLLKSGLVWPFVKLRPGHFQAKTSPNPFPNRNNPSSTILSLAPNPGWVGQTWPDFRPGLS